MQSCTILIILYFNYMLLTIYCNCLVTSPTNNYNPYLILVARNISIIIICRKGTERKGKVKPHRKLTWVTQSQTTSFMRWKRSSTTRLRWVDSITNVTCDHTFIFSGRVVRYNFNWKAVSCAHYKLNCGKSSSQKWTLQHFLHHCTTTILQGWVQVIIYLSRGYSTWKSSRCICTWLPYHSWHK